MTGAQLVLIAAFVLLASCPVVYFLVTLARGWTEAGSYWAFAALCVLLSPIAYINDIIGIGSGWSRVVGNLTATLALGLLWLGCRRYNHRRNRLAIAVLVAIGAGSVTMTLLDPGLFSVGALVRTTLLVTLSVLTAVECLRAPLRLLRPAWIIVLAMCAHLTYLGWRVTTLQLLRDSAPTVVFSIPAVSIGNALFVSVATAAVVALHVRETNTARREGLDLLELSAAGGRLLSPREFRALPAQQAPAGTIEIEVADNRELRIAFGFAVAREVEECLVAAVAAALPEGAAVCRLGQAHLAVRMEDGPAATGVSFAHAARSEFGQRIGRVGVPLPVRLEIRRIAADGALHEL